MLEIDAFGLCFDSGLELTPSIPQLGCAMGIGHRRRFKKGAVHATKDVRQADLRRGSRQLIAAFLSPDAAHDLVRFEFDQDLHQVARRQAVLAGDLIEPGGRVEVMPAGQGKHGTRGIIAFDGQLQEVGV